MTRLISDSETLSEAPLSFIPIDECNEDIPSNEHDT